MTRRTRRRRLREEFVAPLLVLMVILGLWWLGARLVSAEWVRKVTSAPPPASERGPSTASETSRPPVQDGPVAQVRAPAAPPANRPLTDEREQAPATAATPANEVLPQDVDALRARRLRVPVEGKEPAALASTFQQGRGNRSHEAMDILAPRGTPVLAVEGGRIQKLFTSERGGLTIYQFDESESFCYYYAHLDRYAPQLAEGAIVSGGDTIGFVGSTGNADANAPHLHFAIFKLGPERRWWEGLPIDPYLVLR